MDGLLYGPVERESDFQSVFREGKAGKGLQRNSCFFFQPRNFEETFCQSFTIKTLVNRSISSTISIHISTFFDLNPPNFSTLIFRSLSQWSKDVSLVLPPAQGASGGEGGGCASTGQHNPRITSRGGSGRVRAYKTGATDHSGEWMADAWGLGVGMVGSALDICPSNHKITRIFAIHIYTDQQKERSPCHKAAVLLRSVFARVCEQFPEARTADFSL